MHTKQSIRSFPLGPPYWKYTGDGDNVWIYFVYRFYFLYHIPHYYDLGVTRKTQVCSMLILIKNNMAWQSVFVIRLVRSDAGMA